MGSWLQAALLYAKHLPAVRSIVSSFKNYGLLEAKAQDIIQYPVIPMQNTGLQTYEPLLMMISALESTSSTIKCAFELIKSLNLKEDPCKIHAYIEKRLVSNGITSIVAMDRSEVSLHMYCLLQELSLRPLLLHEVFRSSRNSQRSLEFSTGKCEKNT